ncbi:MAG: hypothetical protein U1E78_11645 [Gammaproteobacteria bacterium]
MLKKINLLGHPFHGLVQDGFLVLPNQQTISYPGLTNGDTQLVAIPNYPAPIRTTEEQARDAANGLSWLNYALATDNHLGGVDLGLGWLLYVDANQIVWHLKLGYEVIGSQCFMSCTLLSVFGRFNGDYPVLSRQLVQASTALAPIGNLKSMNRFTYERKSDGSEVLIHVYADLHNGNVIDFPEPMSLYEVWKLELLGEGQLAIDESLGLGITANLTKLKSFSEIQVQSQQNLLRQDNRYRLGKVNIVEEYDPGLAEPPECLNNTFRQTFDLALIPEGEDFIPFILDRNVYIQTNWFGQTDSTMAIARMLFDATGNIHALSIKKENKQLNRFFQTFSGSGTGQQGPIQYFYNDGVCALNGDPPAFVEEYQGVQYVESVLKISKETTLFLDDNLIEKISLEGETSQKANTVIGQAVVNEVKVKVKINDETVREVTKQPGQIPNYILANPFAGFLPNDNANGVYAKFYLGLLSNNLLGQFADRYTSSDMPAVTRKASHFLMGPGVIDAAVKNNAAQFYLKGSFHPMTGELERYINGIQGCV